MAQLIELRVGDPSQLFDERDPSPPAEKDLSKHAEQFILEWARHLPGRDFDLRIHLVRCDRVDNEQVLVEAIHAHFTREAEATRRKLRRSFRIGRISLIIGVVFLAVILTVGELIRESAGDSRGLRILGESLTIGGWVAMWRPLEFFLYDWWPVRNDIRMLEGLSRAPIEVVCGKAVGA